jgi:hypothetical protein
MKRKKKEKNDDESEFNDLKSSSVSTEDLLS